MDPIALAQAGGWAVVVAMITAIGVGVVKRWWIPGWIYTVALKRAEKAEAVADRAVALAEEATANMKKALDARKADG